MAEGIGPVRPMNAGTLWSSSRSTRGMIGQNRMGSGIAARVSGERWMRCRKQSEAGGRHHERSPLANNVLSNLIINWGPQPKTTPKTPERIDAALRMIRRQEFDDPEWRENGSNATRFRNSCRVTGKNPLCNVIDPQLTVRAHSRSCLIPSTV